MLPLFRRHKGKIVENPEGLGDHIANFTHATGIAQVVHAVSEATGIDCGCEKRRKELNERYPSKKEG